MPASPRTKRHSAPPPKCCRTRLFRCRRIFFFGISKAGRAGGSRLAPRRTRRRVKQLKDGHESHSSSQTHSRDCAHRNARLGARTRRRRVAKVWRPTCFHVLRDVRHKNEWRYEERLQPPPSRDERSQRRLAKSRIDTVPAKWALDLLTQSKKNNADVLAEDDSSRRHGPAAQLTGASGSHDPSNP